MKKGVQLPVPLKIFSTILLRSSFDHLSTIPFPYAPHPHKILTYINMHPLSNKLLSNPFFEIKKIISITPSQSIKFIKQFHYAIQLHNLLNNKIGGGAKVSGWCAPYGKKKKKRHLFIHLFILFIFFFFLSFSLFYHNSIISISLSLSCLAMFMV